MFGELLIYMYGVNQVDPNELHFIFLFHIFYPTNRHSQALVDFVCVLFTESVSQLFHEEQTVDWPDMWRVEIW